MSAEQLISDLRTILADCDRWIEFVRGYNADHPRRRPLDAANFIASRNIIKKAIYAVEHNEPLNPKWLESIEALESAIREARLANDAREAKLKRKRKRSDTDG